MSVFSTLSKRKKNFEFFSSDLFHLGWTTARRKMFLIIQVSIGLWKSSKRKDERVTIENVHWRRNSWLKMRKTAKRKSLIWQRIDHRHLCCFSMGWRVSIVYLDHSCAERDLSTCQRHEFAFDLKRRRIRRSLSFDSTLIYRTIGLRSHHNWRIVCWQDPERRGFSFDRSIRRRNGLTRRLCSRK